MAVADREIDDDRIAGFCQVLVDHGVEFVVIGGPTGRQTQEGQEKEEAVFYCHGVAVDYDFKSAALSRCVKPRVDQIPPATPTDFFCKYTKIFGRHAQPNASRRGLTR